MAAKVLVPVGGGKMKVLYKESEEYRDKYQKIMEELESIERSEELRLKYEAIERRIGSTYSKYITY